MYDHAIVFAQELIRKIKPYLFEDKQVDLNTVFSNLSFNSGIACDHQEGMKYFKNYRKKDNK